MTVRRLMGDGELTRLVEVLRDLDQRRLTTDAAAQLLGLERRQVKGPVDPRMLNVRNRRNLSVRSGIAE